MSRRNIVIVLALLVVIMPFVGFPRSWEDVFIVVAGITIVLCTADFKKFRRKNHSRNGKRGRKTGPDGVYVEHVPFRPVTSSEGAENDTTP